MKFAGIWRGSAADVNGVEVRERGAVGVVDGAMALVGDDEIEISVAEAARPELPGNGVERADDDLAFEAAFPAVENLVRIIAKVIAERFLG